MTPAYTVPTILLNLMRAGVVHEQDRQAEGMRKHGSETGTIQMNPNDGFDLGLMTTRYEIDLVLGADVDPGDTENTDAAAATLLLKNEIANGEVHVSATDVKRLSNIDAARVYRIDDSTDRPKLVVTGK